MKLTNRAIENLRPEGTRRIVWDDELPGLGVVIQPTGTKSWVFNYRNADGVQRRFTIGKTSAIAADVARKKALALRGEIVKDRDPQGELEARRKSLTVGQLLDAYLACEKFQTLTPYNQQVTRARLNNHIRSTLGSQKCRALTRETIRRTVRTITEGGTSVDVKTGLRGRKIVRGGEGAARMAIRNLSTAWNWAKQENLLSEANPCEGVDLGRDGQREGYVESSAVYRQVFDTIDAMEAEGEIRSPVAAAIKLIAFTGMRRGEAANLRWRHFRGDHIRLEAGEHKAGKRTARPKIIALVDAARAAIESQPRGEDDDLVFQPARRSSGPTDLTHSWERIRGRAGIDSKLTLHSLRHSVASHMALAGAQGPEIMLALGHAQIATTTRYIHAAQEARAAIAEKAASVAVSALGENVIPLKRRSIAR